jgi:hypothetical protein
MIRPALLAGAGAIALAGLVAPAPASAATLSPPGCTGNQYDARWNQPGF